MENRIREMERQLGRKTLEVEIVKEALDRSRTKKAILFMRPPLKEGFAVNIQASAAAEI